MISQGIFTPDMANVGSQIQNDKNFKRLILYMAHHGFEKSDRKKKRTKNRQTEL